MSIRFPLFIGSNCLTADTKNKTTYFIRCENPPLCWLKLLLLLLLLLLKLNLALLASKPPFPGNSYGYCGTVLHFCAGHNHNHHHLLVEIANNITSDAIQGHSNPFPNEYERRLLSQKKLLFEAQILILTDCSQSFNW